MDAQTYLRPFLEKSMRPGISDLHLKPGEPPLVRYLGKINSLGGNPVKPEELDALAEVLLTETQKEILKLELAATISFAIDDLGRMRLHFYRQKGLLSLSARLIPLKPSTFEQLLLPKDTLEHLCSIPKGLLLITGSASSGRTTALNAFINHMNENSIFNIVTLEEPVEFVHVTKKSSISQREVGRDIPSLKAGLNQVFKENADVVAVSDLNSPDNLKLAIETASQGVMVIGTFDGADVFESFERAAGLYPVEEQPHFRNSFANALKGIISLRLVSNKNGGAFLPISEIFVGSFQMRKLLVSGNPVEIKFGLERGGAFGMKTFDQDLARLVAEATITPDEAYLHASHPNDLRIKLEAKSKAASDQAAPKAANG